VSCKQIVRKEMVIGSFVVAGVTVMTKHLETGGGKRKAVAVVVTAEVCVMLFSR